MNKKCIILGAGFSKSISNLPTTIELLNSFKEVQETQKELGNNNRVKWGDKIFDFIDYLQKNYLDEPYSRADKGAKILEHNYFENFEAICSLIDLNLLAEVNALSEVNGIRSGLSGKPLFLNKTIPELKQIRGLIGTYMKLALINAETNKNLLEHFDKKFMNNTNAIITFNYDLILERYFFSKKLWFPKDGYGFIVKSIPEISESYNTYITKTPILKMHGSLNWKTESFFQNEFELEWFDDHNNFFFPKYLSDERKRNFEYQGAFSTNAWVYPSWIKQFSFPELYKVWQIAAQKISTASEIIFIGYSLPSADSTVYSFFASMDFRNKKVIIIDPNADELLEKYSLLFPRQNIFPINNYLENYLEQSF